MLTVGEMLDYTNRFKNIIGSNASNDIKNIRLANLMSDLEAAYQIPILKNRDFESANPFLMQLYRTISEARNL